MGLGWYAGHQFVGGVGGWLQVGIAGEAFEQPTFLLRLEAEFHAVGQLDLALAARINAAFHHLRGAEELLRLQLQPAAKGSADGFGFVIEGKLEFVEPQHPPFPLSTAFQHPPCRAP